MRLQDQDLCPSGKYEGTEMEFVPASYLLWWEQVEDCPPEVRGYVDWARSCLEQEVKRGSRLW